MYMKKIILLLLFTIVISSCQSPKNMVDLLITNSSIVDLSNGSIKTGKLIGIIQDTIAFINDMDDLHKFNSKQLVDANDKFVMPGLWDNHVHFRGGDSLVNENKNLLPLFIAHGITTVRDAGGDISSSVLEWKAKIKKGDLVGPAIYTSGPKLDGPKRSWAGSIIVENQEDVKRAIDSLEQLKVDYVKIYNGSLSVEMYYEIIKEAEARGFKVTGHKPSGANLIKAADLGLDGVEHANFLMMITSTKGDSLRNLSPAGIYDSETMEKLLVENFDIDLARQNLIELASKQFYVTPTVYVAKVLRDLAETDHSMDSLLAYIGPGIQKTYARRINTAKRFGERFKNYLHNDFNYSMNLYPLLYETGINILAGSDCGPFNSHVYPGSSLHSELELMVAAGLTPLQALKTSVVNGPKFFGLDKQYGNVEVGKIAYLIILEKNPLEEIKNTRSVSTVIQGTIVYESAKIKDLMSTLKQSY